MKNVVSALRRTRRAVKLQGARYETDAARPWQACGGGDPRGGVFAAAPARGHSAPRSRIRKFAGVQIGLNVPYNFGGRDMNADELLDRFVKLNVNAVEMRSQPVESFLGSPAANGQKVDAEVMRQVARDGFDGSRRRISKEVRRRRRADRNREIRRHLQHGGRGSGLLLQPRAHARRTRHLVRDRRQAHAAHRAVRRQAQADGRAITATRRPRPAHWEAAFTQARLQRRESRSSATSSQATTHRRCRF